MKRFIIFAYISIALACCAVFSGCNSNNGDIGDWYGHWKLTEIRINGEIDTQYQANVFWAFQSSVVMMTEVTDATTTNRWGSWSEDGDKLILNFDNHDDMSVADPSTDWRYTPPACTHLAKGINTLHIDKLSKSEIKLTYNAPDGNVYTYLLRAWK